ncbi:MAG: hypothetical protein Q4E24_09550, partial [bacterium]|nr:hypothetical protein [bacterium]
MKRKVNKAMLAVSLAVCMATPTNAVAFAQQETTEKNVLENVEVSKNILKSSMGAQNVATPQNATALTVDETQFEYAIHYYDGNGEIAKSDTGKSSKEVKKTLPSRVFQIPGYRDRVEEGYKCIGWSTEEGSDTVEYTFGQKVTLSSEESTLNLYPVYALMDTFSVEVSILYIDESLDNGYAVGDAETIDLQCKNYAMDHPESGSMHQVDRNVLYQDAKEAIRAIRSGYEIVGLSSGNASAEPRLLDMSSSELINCTEGANFYLVAKKAPETTYTVRYHIYGTDEVKEESRTVKASEYGMSLYSRVFQIADYKARMDEGLKLIGWSTTEGAEVAEYEIGGKAALTSENPTVDLYPVYGPLDTFHVKVSILYVDESLENGYTTSEEKEIDLTCQNYSIGHPGDGYMHQVDRNVLYQDAKEAIRAIRSGYEI